MRKTVILASLLEVFVVGVGCKKHEQEAQASPTPKEGPAAQADQGKDSKKSVGSGTSHVEGPGFVLDVTPASADVASGTASTATVTIKPTAGFHVNKDYPIELDVTPNDAVTIANASQTADDAKKLDETEADFAVSYTPKAAGAQKVLASIQFAVCTPKSCNPKKEMLSFNVNAK
jgi:hypothetical protein